tara:strand:- start:370 stop:699 length:330 start_codon:yes stop_codon:yes gene_type:complete
MPLRWNIEKCEKLDFLKSSELEKAKTEIIIWSSLVINISKITKKNYKEFYNRINIYERLTESGLKYKDGRDYYITLEDIKNRIGFHTNVGDMSDSKFMKNMFRIYKERN